MNQRGKKVLERWWKKHHAGCYSKSARFQIEHGTASVDPTVKLPAVITVVSCGGKLRVVK